MKPLRIIIVMVEPPLPFGNAAARWYYVLLKGLVERGHKVTAFATCSKPEEIAKAQKLFPAPAYDLRCYAHPARSGFKAKWETLRQPYSYMFAPEMKSDLDAELTQGFDVLHLEQLWSGWVGMAHAEKAVVNVLNLLSLDLDGSYSAQSWISRLFAMRAERILLQGFRRICTLTSSLTDHVRKVNPQASVHTIPLGMDLAFYEFIPPSQRKGPPVVSLIGSFDWLPTSSAAIRILNRLWPAIRSACPEAQLQLVGRNARFALRHFNGKEMPGVSIMENVPDILPYFRNTDVLLYPVRHGSGMKVKVLESFALGVPVVTTRVGVEGLPAEDGVHAGIADDDRGLIERTVNLMRRGTAQENQCIAARRLIECHCSAARTLDLLEAVHGQLASHNIFEPDLQMAPN